MTCPDFFGHILGRGFAICHAARIRTSLLIFDGLLRGPRPRSLATALIKDPADLTGEIDGSNYLFVGTKQSSLGVETHIELAPRRNLKLGVPI